MEAAPKYKRILLKLSGEALQGKQGYGIDAEVMRTIAEEIEDLARVQHGEITSAQLGIAVLDRMRCLDEVAYLRFASVYKNFDVAADFQAELVLLKKLQGAEVGAD